MDRGYQHYIHTIQNVVSSPDASEINLPHEAAAQFAPALPIFPGVSNAAAYIFLPRLCYSRPHKGDLGEVQFHPGYLILDPLFEDGLPFLTGRRGTGVFHPLRSFNFTDGRTIWQTQSGYPVVGEAPEPMYLTEEATYMLENYSSSCINTFRQYVLHSQEIQSTLALFGGEHLDQNSAFQEASIVAPTRKSHLEPKAVVCNQEQEASCDNQEDHSNHATQSQPGSETDGHNGDGSQHFSKEEQKGNLEPNEHSQGKNNAKFDVEIEHLPMHEEMGIQRNIAGEGVVHNSKQLQEHSLRVLNSIAFIDPYGIHKDKEEQDAIEEEEFKGDLVDEELWPILSTIASVSKENRSNHETRSQSGGDVQGQDGDASQQFGKHEQEVGFDPNEHALDHIKASSDVNIVAGQLLHEEMDIRRKISEEGIAENSKQVEGQGLRILTSIAISKGREEQHAVDVPEFKTDILEEDLWPSPSIIAGVSKDYNSNHETRSQPGGETQAQNGHEKQVEEASFSSNESAMEHINVVVSDAQVVEHLPIHEEMDIQKNISDEGVVSNSMQVHQQNTRLLNSIAFTDPYGIHEGKEERNVVEAKEFEANLVDEDLWPSLSTPAGKIPSRKTKCKFRKDSASQLKNSS